MCWHKKPEILNIIYDNDDISLKIHCSSRILSLQLLTTLRTLELILETETAFGGCNSVGFSLD
jgi:hypothetical protein